jgi:hypothetical protein
MAALPPMMLDGSTQKNGKKEKIGDINEITRKVGWSN